MAYVEGRVVHDADSHIFEPPGYAEEYADPAMREQLSEALASGETPAFIDAALANVRRSAALYVVDFWDQADWPV